MLRDSRGDVSKEMGGQKPGVFYGKAAVVAAPGPKRIRPQRSFESNCHVGYIQCKIAVI